METFYIFSDILSDCRILTFCRCCSNDVISCVLVRTFLSSLKLLGGNAVMLIILRHCMIIYSVNTDMQVHDDYISM